jgi:glycosyltransferase involved in cell wall biosynthesis
MLFPLPVFFALPFILKRNQLVTTLIKRVNLFVSPSLFLVKEMARHGVSVERFVVIRNGADISKGSFPPAKHDNIRFGFIGGIHRKKGIETLVRAFQGDLGNDLLIRGFADKRSLDRFHQDNPDFKARLEIFDKNKKSFYDNIDVLVVPSICYENQPTVIIEAYQYGKPVVCSEIGGMKEMVRHNITGLFFKPGDAEDLRKNILYLLDNPSEIDRLSASIPQWPGVADNVNKLIDSLTDLKCVR